MPVIAIDSVVMNNQTRKRKVGRPTLESINEAKRAKIPSINTLSRRRKEEERRRKQKKIMDAKPKIRFAAMRKANLTAKIYSTNNGISAILPVKPKPTRQMSRRPGLFNKLKLPLSIKTENVEHRRGDTKQLLSLRADKVFYPAYGFSPLFEESPVPSTSFDFKDLLARRRVLNPLARGIFDQSPVQHFYKDFFYREIFAKRLVDSIEEQANGKEMVDICGDSVNERMDLCQDEFLVFSPAEACAVDIHKALPNRSEFEFLHESTATLDATLLKRALNERVDVAEHLTTLLRFIFLQRLADLSTLNVCAGASMFYSISLANANRLRESLRLYNKSRISCMIDAHCWLLKNLPTYFLASYLNLLRFLKTAGSTLSEYVLEKCALPEFSRANALISEFLSVKVYDPPTNSIAKIMHGIEPIKNICLLLVYPQFTNESYRHSTRPYDPLFKNLLPRIVQVAEKVDLRLELDLNATESAEICTRLCVQLIVKRVREIVKRRPNDHVFLAGWGTSCLLNHKALSYVSGVSGVLDFAFPTETATGPRGDVEDDICLTYCPTLFIVGENACDANLTTLQQLRSNMIMESGLILVGEANQNLFVSNNRLNLERISQKMVDRSIVQHTLDFIHHVLRPKNSTFYTELRPRNLETAYNADINLLKHPENLFVLTEIC